MPVFCLITTGFVLIDKLEVSVSPKSHSYIILMITVNIGIDKVKMKTSII